MSAVAAAFAVSGHGGPVPKIAPNYCPSKVRQTPRRAAEPVSVR
jgi:hypothetical protein